MEVAYFLISWIGSGVVDDWQLFGYPYDKDDKQLNDLLTVYKYLPTHDRKRGGCKEYCVGVIENRKREKEKKGQEVHGVAGHLPYPPPIVVLWRVCVRASILILSWLHSWHNETLLRYPNHPCSFPPMSCMCWSSCNCIEKMINFFLIHHGNVCVTWTTMYWIKCFITTLVLVSFRLDDSTIGNKHGSILIRISLVSIHHHSVIISIIYNALYLWQL